MLSQGEGLREEEREVPKRRSPTQHHSHTLNTMPPHRRWSVSAETLEMSSDSESTTKEKTPRRPVPKKRSHCKENNPANSAPEKSSSPPSPQLLVTSEKSSGGTSASGDSFQSPMKKKKKPSQPSEPKTSAPSSSSLTGLGQLATLHQQDRKPSVAGSKGKEPKKQRGLGGASKKRASGDILGSLK
jgi:hypothetical protein